MTTTPAQLAIDFERVRAASRRAPAPALEVRKARLERLLSMLRDSGAAFEKAISADFGHRAVEETRLAELMPLEASIKHALRHLPRWMAPKRVPTRLIFWPGRNRLLPQPLGVAGIVAPWNYPLQLSLGPAIGALAAGNRVMLKPSELTPAFSTLLQKLVMAHFADDEMVAVTGGAEIARLFCALPFDHLLFTGSIPVGKLVAEAAARNLTPVTLELGGKSPVILHASADVAQAAGRIAYAKILNAGQTCIAPDYVICTSGQVAPFVDAFKKAVVGMIGNDPANPDYTTIISARHLDRLDNMIRDAIEKGARIDYAPDDASRWKAAGKFPPCLALQTTPDMSLRQEEIFGPILPVVTVATDSDAIAHVNAGERPLALYWFGNDRAALDRVLRETVSGGVTVNDCLLHQVQEDQPFGGVGASGYGSYHGLWGFRTFSKEKPVYYRPRLSGIGYMQPPYGATFERILRMLRRVA